MRPRITIARFRDIAVLALLVALNPLISYKSAPPCISDKVEIRVSRPLRADSAQLEEMRYYFRNHKVTDEGYNLIAQYYNLLSRQRQKPSPSPTSQTSPTITRVYIRAKDRLLPAVVIGGGYWKAGRFLTGTPQGPTILHDEDGHIVSAVMEADTAVTGIRVDSTGTYRGQMNRLLQASGQGIYDGVDGTHYEGFWQYGKRDGFGFESSPHHQVRVGIWKKDRFLGEKLRYTTERIYGIDISRHQHEKGRKRYSINWNDLRITSLGSKHHAGGQTFPVSFVYIKSTEGTTVRNRYFLKDYAAAKAKGIRTGAYHFFSLKTPVLAQATYFVNHTLFRPGDFPPVLDVEPTDGQIRKIGGTEELLRRIRIFMEYVEKRTGMKPILYTNQGFVNRHLANAADIKQRYNVWIARYGEYKPDVKLVYWQLTPDGRVNGITGPVDINVFNGYQGQWDEFCRTGFHK